MAALGARTAISTARRAGGAGPATRRARAAAMGGAAGREVGAREGGRPQTWLPGKWPDPELVDYCGENFPDEGICSAEQAMCLMEDYGYTFLDVRSDPELNVHAVIRTGVHVPIINAKKLFRDGKVDYDQTVNREFVNQVKTKGLTADSKIIVCCSDGRQRAIMALMALDDAGFTNIVGMKGGVNLWTRIFDSKMVRRLQAEAKEVYSHEGDGCGIHGSGANFAKVDSVLFDLGPVQDEIDWIDWQEEMGQ